jgi:hypothetical protein
MGPADLVFFNLRNFVRIVFEVGISSGNNPLTRCAFVGTNPTDELITSGLPVTRE